MLPTAPPSSGSYDNLDTCMLCSPDEELAAQGLDHIPDARAQHNEAANDTEAKGSVDEDVRAAASPTSQTEAAPRDGHAASESPPPHTFVGGARVRFHGLVKCDHLNGLLGFCMPPPADSTERIRALVASTGQVALVKAENLEPYGEEPTGEDEVDLTTCLMKPLGIDLLHGKRGLDANNHAPMALDTRNNNTTRPTPTARFSLLASLAPIAYETIHGIQVDGSIMDCDPGDPDGTFEYAVMSEADTPNAHSQNEGVWLNTIDPKIKRVVTVLVNSGLLPWSALLEDGNILWEIGFTDTAEWPEPDRWVLTVCSFLQLLAWEYTVLRPKRLYPTVRFEIVRDLFLREWQERSRRLGHQLWPLYFPAEAGSSAAHAQAANAAALSAYEEERNKQVLKNQAMLAMLGITGLVQEHRNQQLPAEKKGKDKMAPATAPTRASARVASMPDRPQYAPETEALASDDDMVPEEEDGEETDDDEHAGSDSDASDELGGDYEAEPGQPSSSRNGSKARRAPKATVKPKPKPSTKNVVQKGERRMNVVKTRGKFASVTPKGRGFLCRHPGCGRIEATAELVLEHARDEHGLEGREVVDLRHVRCLWEGCGKLIAVQLTTAGHLKLRDLLNHEALHRQATSAPRGFLCPGAGCDKSFDKSDGAWECGETHGVERDDKRCLYENCGRVFPSRCSYRAHEPTHTNIWTFTCPTCDKGHKSATLADNCHVVGAACVCRWWYPANRCKANLAKALASHLRKCKGGREPDVGRVGSRVPKGE